MNATILGISKTWMMCYKLLSEAERTMKTLFYESCRGLHRAKKIFFIFFVYSTNL